MCESKQEHCLSGPLSDLYNVIGREHWATILVRDYLVVRNRNYKLRVKEVTTMNHELAWKSREESSVYFLKH